MSRYQPYPSYKDSGVEWLGEVPEYWDFKALKYSMQSIQTGTTPSTSDQTFFDGDIHWFNPKDLNNEILKLSERKISKKAIDNNEAKLFPMDSVLIVGIGATTGKTSYLSLEASFNQQITGLHSYSNNNKYFFYQIKSFANEFLNLANFTTLPILNNEFLKNFAVVTPTLPEQTAIANFLDIQTAKIDTLIAKQQRMIELLGEKRSAMISHAVTKGIDPDVAMKDSGVKWLGEVPEHWKIGLLKRFASRIIVGIAEAATQAYADKGIPILRATNIRQGKIIGDLLLLDEKFANSPERISKQIKSGDLITVRTGNAGVTAIASEDFDGAHCFTMLVTTLTGACLNRFVEYYIGTSYPKTYFSIEGWGTAQVNISVPILENLPIALASIDEQQKIVQYLDTQTGKIDTLIAKARQAIELMKERRTALISAAVTGKIDVRATR